MIKQKTINKVKKFLQDIKNSKYNTISSYCKANGINPNSWYSSIRRASEDSEVKDLLNSFKNSDTCNNEIPVSDEIAESTKYVRDAKERIIGYKFNITRKVGGPLIGTLSRTQMDTLCGLYSRYGADLTAAQTSLDFPEYSLDELNRIKKVFLIFKYSCPFAPHEIDEHTEEELHNLAIERKKNNLTRTLEKNQLKDALKINLKLASENEQLRNFKDYISKIKIDITGLTSSKVNVTPTRDWDLMLNLADLHIGAKVESHSLYENTWTEENIHERLNSILIQISNLGTFNTIFLNLLGDMLDGMDNQTARRDHIMPQGMDNYEQFDVFFRQLTWFITELNKLGKKLIIHSVPNGNHTGAPEYIAMNALKYALSNVKNITMTVFNKFIGHYFIGNDVYLITHGKDDKFMKKPLPLHLSKDSIVWLNNYLDREGITKVCDPGHIHIIKGDMHTAGYDNTYKFDYRNCLSLFGDSDYSQMNYNSNPRGCSYSLLIGNQILNGEFVVC